MCSFVSEYARDLENELSDRQTSSVDAYSYFNRIKNSGMTPLQYRESHFKL